VQYSDDLIRRVLTAKTIAVVGFSASPARASHGVAQFLQARGHRIVPVNPGLAGQTLLGEKVYASLADVPGSIDMVDVFRNSAQAGGVVDEAIALKAAKGIKSVWMQLDVIDEAAAKRGEAAGLTVIMDRCPKIEVGRLGL
jgi:predicted CoA-binding protein